jgi:hypothetical protein
MQINIKIPIWECTEILFSLFPFMLLLIFHTHIIGVPPYSNSILYRFHPSCMGMTIEQAKKLDHFVCSDCVKENGSKRLSNAYATSPNSEPKVS